MSRTRVYQTVWPPLPVAIALLATLLAVTGPLAAQDRTDPLPSGLENVGIDEKLNAQLPLDLEFTAHDGKKVRLRDYFDGKHPVILTLNYYKCPMLCGLMLNGLLDGIKELDWTAGDEYQIVTVSFDPLETPQLASLKRQNYLQQYGRPASAQGWHFLTGRRPSIDAILGATGFRIAWNEQRQEWSHAAAIMVCTPDGRIARYLYGILFEPKTLRLSLVEASEGKVGSTLDRVLLYCYHYDGERYSLAAMNVVRASGLVTMLIVGTFLLILWRRERRRSKVVAPTS